MKINMDAMYDEATRVAWEVLAVDDFSLDSLNVYMHMFEPQHMIFYTYQWPGGMWTGEAQCWNNDVDAGHIVTRKTYATHEEALAGILNEVKITVTMYEN
jgi:hypothetical protein